MLALANTLAAAGFAPARLEAAMLAAVMASGGSAWYVPDDFLTLGPELVPSGSFDSSAGWTLGAGWAISGGKLTATAAATGSSSVINAGLVAGKNYLVRYDIDSISAGATTPIANGATSTQQTTSGQKVSLITPAGNSGNVGLNSSSATALTATFDNLSVREILSAKDFQDSAGTLPTYLGGTVGRANDAAGSANVTQATAGNRPLVSRIPRKLGPELVTNGTFDADASWTKGTGWSISGGLATKAAAGVAANLDQVANLSGKNVAVSFTVSGRTAGTVSALLVESGVGASTLGSASANGSFTFVGARPTTGVFRINSDSVFDGSIDNISVREVLELSYALTFDGSNDSLATPASVIGATLTQPYTMIAWGKVGALGANRWMIGDSARLLGVSSNNKFAVGHAGTQTYDSSYTPSAGEIAVMEATYDGGANVKAWVNGVQVMSNGVAVAPVTSAAATNIGQRGDASGYWQGEVGGAVVCPAVMTDEQRLAVRKFAAAQMGMTL